MVKELKKRKPNKNVNIFQSYLELNKWEQMIVDRSPIKSYLIANKIDLPQRAISTDEGFEYAQSHNLEYFEISTLMGAGWLQ